jgi:hypothetical protein
MWLSTSSAGPRRPLGSPREISPWKCCRCPARPLSHAERYNYVTSSKLGLQNKNPPDFRLTGLSLFSRRKVAPWDFRLQFSTIQAFSPVAERPMAMPELDSEEEEPKQSE